MPDSLPSMQANIGPQGGPLIEVVALRRRPADIERKMKSASRGTSCDAFPVRPSDSAKPWRTATRTNP
ncbi:hypothetical protein MYA_5953 [Burkholderia sp. KJ006]|nr:hypothetical protein MYA_5953 [Burkholderia sp. KJ006]